MAAPDYFSKAYGPEAPVDPSPPPPPDYFKKAYEQPSSAAPDYFSKAYAQPADPLLSDPQVARNLPTAVRIADAAREQVDLDGAREAFADHQQRFGDSTEGAILADRAARKIPALAKVVAAPKFSRELLSQAGMTAEPEPTGLVGALSLQRKLKENIYGPVQKAIDYVQRPQRVVGALIDPKIPLSEYSPAAAWRGEQGQSGEVWANMKAKADEPGFSPYDVLVPQFKAIGAPLAYGGAVAGAVPALAHQLIQEGPQSGKSLEQSLEGAWGAIKDAPGNFKATFDESLDRGGEFAYQTLTDPVNVPGFGALPKGAAFQAGKQFERVMRNSGKAAGATAAGREAALIMSEFGGSVQLAPKMAELAQKYALPAKEVERVLGPGFTYAGRSGLSVGVGKAQMEVGPAVNYGVEKITRGAVKLPEQAGRRALEPLRKAYEGGRRAIGEAIPDVGYHEKIGLERTAASGRYNAQAASQERLTQYNTDVVPYAPKDAARREAIFREHVDPEWNRVTGGRETPLTTQLTPTEAKWVDAHRKFFEAFEADIQKLGGGIEKNPITGMYVPRQYRSDPSGFTSLLAHEMGGATNPLKSRAEGGGRSLAENYRLEQAKAPNALKGVYDPHEIVTTYIPRLEATKAKASWERYAADNFAEIPDAHVASTKQTHTPMRNSKGEEVLVPNAIAQMHKQAFNSVEGKKFIGRGMDTVMKWFKELNTLPMPRYHITNMNGDLTLMYAFGFRDLGAFRRAQRVLKGEIGDSAVAITTPYRTISGAEARSLLREHGFSQGTAGQFDVDPMQGISGMKKEFAKTADRAAVERGELGELRALGRSAARQPGEVFKQIQTGGTLAAGRHVAQTWDEGAKSAFFIDLLQKGESPAMAAARVYQAMPDYMARSAALEGYRRIVPFGTWQAKMLESMPKAIAANPGILNHQRRIIETMAGERDPKRRDAPPPWAAERGANVSLGPEMRYAARATAPEGAEIHPGYGLNWQLREAPWEAMAPPLALLEGNTDPFTLGAGPIWQGAYEYVSERDALTKQDLNRPDSLGDMFPAGMPGIHESLQTDTYPGAPVQEIPYVSRNAPQMVLSPWAMLAAEKALDGRYLGRHRDLGGIQDSQRQHLSLLNLLFGTPLSLTTPLDPFEQQMRSRAVERGESLESDVMRGVKKAATRQQKKSR